MQCWRRVSHLRLLRWINKFTLFYDAYFAPLKDKHHYWFGTLLLVRIALLVTFTAASSTTSKLTLLLLQFMLIILLFYTSIRPVYKSKLVRMLDSTSLLNLIVLVGSTLFIEYTRAVFIEISIAIAFIQLIAVVIYSMIMVFYSIKNKYRKNYNRLPCQDEMFHERIEDSEISEENVNNLRNTLTALSY